LNSTLFLQSKKGRITKKEIREIIEKEDY